MTVDGSVDVVFALKTWELYPSKFKFFFSLLDLLQEFTYSRYKKLLKITIFSLDVWYANEDCQKLKDSLLPNPFTRSHWELRSFRIFFPSHRIVRSIVSISKDIRNQWPQDFRSASHPQLWNIGKMISTN